MKQQLSFYAHKRVILGKTFTRSRGGLHETIDEAKAERDLLSGEYHTRIYAMQPTDRLSNGSIRPKRYYLLICPKTPVEQCTK